jgi:hypothetical protein
MTAIKGKQSTRCETVGSSTECEARMEVYTGKDIN